MIMAHHGHKLGYSALRSSAPMPTPTMVSYGMRLGRRQSELGELGVTEIGRPADGVQRMQPSQTRVHICSETLHVSVRIGIV